MSVTEVTPWRRAEADTHGLNLLRQLVTAGVPLDESKIIPQLIRLAAHSDGPSDLEPGTRLGVAQAALSSGSLNRVATDFGLHHSQAERAVRDTAAIMLYLAGEAFIDNASPRVLSRLSLLKTIAASLHQASEVREHPAMRAVLHKLPHVQDLIDYYLAFGTVRYALESVKVRSYTEYQLRSLGRFLFTEDPDEALDGITTLARRFLVGRWLIGDGKFNGDRGDTMLSKAAFFLLSESPSHLPGRLPDTIRFMRLFLKDMML